MGSQLLASKIVVQEEEPTVRNIEGVPTNIAAFTGITERGPFGKTRISSISEFDAVFGGLTANAVDLPIALKGYFDEAGGAALKCYISRTVHHSDIANAGSRLSEVGTIDLVTATVAATAGTILGTIAEFFSLTDGETLQVDVDASGADTVTFNAAAATKTSANAGTYVLTDGQTLTYDTQTGPQSIVFDAAEFVAIGAATALEVAAVINSESAGISADVDGGAVRITTDQQGSGASLDNFAGTANGALGFAGSASGTGDAVDASAVTAAEMVTLIEGDVTGVTVTVTVESGAVRITSDTTGVSSSIQIPATGTIFPKLGFDNATHSGAAAGSVPTLTVNGKTDGAYANSVSVEVLNATSIVAGEFNLNVSEGGVLAEVFPNLTVETIEEVVNGTGGSVLIAVVDLDVLTAPNNRPVNVTAALAGGNDGLASLDDNDFVGSSVSLTGIRAFDQTNDISLMAVPGRATSAVHNSLLTYCEVTRSGSMFAVLDSPAGNSAAQIVTYVKTTAILKESSEFGAIYWPRIKIDNPNKTLFGNSATIIVAPSGHICGVYARTDSAFGGAGVYEAPAGITVGRIFSSRGVETEEANDENKRDLVFPELINPIVAEDGRPTHIDGARCLKSTGNFPTIGERRGIIFIANSLRTGLDFAKHRKIKAKTRNQLDRTTELFMITQTRNGAFASDDPNKAFFVDWGEALNPPSVAFGRKIVGRLGVATAKPAEFIIVRISQDTRALDAELAAAAA